MNKKIGTHSGIFHADDAMACLMLTKYTNEFQNATIQRTRDQEILKTMDLVVDVGGIYDPQQHRYDHHQSTFNETFNNNFKTKLSGSGLIYKHFGNEILKNALEQLFQQEDFKQYKIDLNDEQLEVLKLDMYKFFFEFLDGVDNGIERYPKDVKPNYQSNGTNLCSRVGNLNQKWWDNQKIDPMQNFNKAMELCNDDFLNILKNNYAKLFISFKWVEEAINNRKEIDESGQIIFLKNACYWKDAMFQLEKKLKLEKQILYVIFPTKTEGYRVQCMPIESNSFTNRKSLKKEWNGKDQEELKNISGINDIVFCHHSGFIGGALSFESALKMARISMNNN